MSRLLIRPPGLHCVILKGEPKVTKTTPELLPCTTSMRKQKKPQPRRNDSSLTHTAITAPPLLSSSSTHFSSSRRIHNSHTARGRTTSPQISGSRRSQKRTGKGMRTLKHGTWGSEGRQPPHPVPSLLTWGGGRLALNGIIDNILHTKMDNYFF